MTAAGIGPLTRADVKAARELARATDPDAALTLTERMQAKAAEIFGDGQPALRTNGARGPRRPSTRDRDPGAPYGFVIDVADKGDERCIGSFVTYRAAETFRSTVMSRAVDVTIRPAREAEATGARASRGKVSPVPSTAPSTDGEA